MEIMEGENVTKVDALLEIIHQARENPKLVEAIEALLVGEQSVRDSAGKDPDPGKKDAAPKQQEAKPKKAAPTAPQKKPGRKTVDTGKIKSLRQGGWTVAEIADDLGCSQQTVRNNLAKMGMR